MRSNRSKWISCFASVWVLASTAVARAQYAPSTSQTGSGSGQTATRSRQFCGSKDLVGAGVKDAQGEKLGRITEVYVNSKDGETLAAVDLGRRRYAIVPVQAFVISPTPGLFRRIAVTLNKNKSDLESGPVVANNNWSMLDDSSFTLNAYSHYNVQPPPATGGASSPGGVSTGGATNLPPLPVRPLSPTPIQSHPLQQ